MSIHLEYIIYLLAVLSIFFYLNHILRKYPISNRKKKVSNVWKENWVKYSNESHFRNFCIDRFGMGKSLLYIKIKYKNIMEFWVDYFRYRKMKEMGENKEHKNESNFYD